MSSYDLHDEDFSSCDLPVLEQNPSKSNQRSEENTTETNTGNCD